MASLEWAHIEAFDNEQRSALTPRRHHRARRRLQPCSTAICASSLILLCRRRCTYRYQRCRTCSRARRPRTQSRYISFAARAHVSHVASQSTSPCIVMTTLSSISGSHVEDYLLLQAFEAGSTLSDAIDAAFVESSIAEADRPAHINPPFTTSCRWAGSAHLTTRSNYERPHSRRIHARDFLHHR